MSRPGLRASILVKCFVILFSLASPEEVVASGLSEGSGMQLTSPVRQQLKKLRDAWTSWARAYYQDDAEEAESYLEQMLAISAHLDLPKLPDLAVAASGYAVQSALDGDRSRAEWALEAARRLDPEAADVEFAAATIHWKAGEVVGALVDLTEGYRKLYGSRFESRLATRSLMLWVYFTFAVASLLFFVFLFAAQGPRLVGQLIEMFAARLPGAGAAVATLVMLGWPLLLPRGVLWTLVLWSVLVWTYSTVSQRLVLVCIWTFAAFAPSGIAYQQRLAQVDLAPPTRLIENLQSGRLYGSMFTDLQVLRSLLPEDERVSELVADLHRKLGQWEHARSGYTQLIEDQGVGEFQKANALCNIGVYHQRKSDPGTAVNYFKRAAEANSRLTEAFYNLSQAYSHLYKFPQSHQSLTRARELSSVAVDEWDSIDRVPENATIPVDGGLRQSDAIYSALMSTWGAPGETSSNSKWSWSLSLLALIIGSAFLVDLLRRNFGSLAFDREPSDGFQHPVARVLVPGWSSTRAGRGWSSFVAVLFPAGFLVAWQLRSLALKPALGIDPDRGLLLFVVGVLVSVWLLSRVSIEWMRSGS